MIERELFDAELRNVAELETMYRECAELVMPAGMGKNPVPSARAYMTALRGVERCIELRLKLVREAGRLPEPESEKEEPMVMIDFSKLSYEALHEVKQALIPVGTSDNGEEELDEQSEICEKPKKKKMSPLTQTTKRTKQSKRKAESEVEMEKRQELKPET